MLVLKRRPGQGIDVGNDVKIILQEIRGGQVKIAIVAPDDVRVKRSEITDTISRENIRAAESCSREGGEFTNMDNIEGLLHVLRGKDD
jgi:carbon storage regulator